MPKKNFKKVRIDKLPSKFKIAEERVHKLDPREDDIRTKFARDYTRIIHCFGFRRLKHKTQVFFAPYDDHICTRLEHALHVTSIAQTISKELGLNTELVTSIAIGHDLGHAPFGHHGEGVLDDLWRVNIAGLKKKNKRKKEENKYFWHEHHGLKVVDYFESVKDYEGFQQNLNLTFATRDGIICHCGEGKFKNPIKPRNEKGDLLAIKEPGKFRPFTWEGCVVKISDLISYLGRDLEDAETSNIIENGELNKLKDSINQKNAKLKINDMCNSAIIHALITDLCKNSDPDRGLDFSDDGKELISQVYDFDYDKIYYNKKLNPYKNYVELMLETIFNGLKEQYEENIYRTLENIKKSKKTVFKVFNETWLEKFYQLKKSYEYVTKSPNTREKMKKRYTQYSEKEYYEAILDYLAGFTDNFVKTCYEEIVSVV